MIRPFGSGLALGLAALWAPSAEAVASLQEPRLTPRQVAAPASDIISGRLRLPDPSAGAVRSRGALVELTWERAKGDGWLARAVVPVLRGEVGLAVQSRDASGLEVSATPRFGPSALIEPEAFRRDQVLPLELGGEEVQRWDLAVSSSGPLEIEVRASGTEMPARARLAVRDEQRLTAAAYVSTHELTSDRRMALVAQVERDGDGVTEERWLHAVSSARARLEGPGGQTVELLLSDDGRSGDDEAGDGRFGAWLPYGLSGAYGADVALEGIWNGARFLRTTRVTFDVSEPALALVGDAVGVVEDARRIRLGLGVLRLGSAARVQLSGEVWGFNAAGQQEPMAWLSLIQPVQSSSSAARGDGELRLWLDARWLPATGLQPPLELRQVRVQDPDTLNVLASSERMSVRLDPRWESMPALGEVPPASDALAGLAANAAVGGSAIGAPAATDIAPGIPSPGLVLSHGYCAGSPPWPNGDFTQPKLAFSDLSQNRSHDEFATRIASQASGFTSFGVVGHSQGGAAALHLLTFYSSGLDRAQGARRIQSVGTPYQGTPLASLGFFACGVNNNLTPGGASTWLAGIPSWARAEVSYYTTANDGGACQFLTDLLLSNPEDGTTERSRGQLPGAVNMGHVTGWCHTTGMSDPPQYRDGSRNAIMDVNAAR